jgi:plastocyanin
MQRTRTIAGSFGALILATVLAACGGGGTSPSATAAAASNDANAPRIEAKDLMFLQTSVNVPAGKPFALAFDNQENLPHNVAIKDPSGKEVFTGEILTAVGSTTYQVPALAAGGYTFICSVHPQMTGTMTAQ